MTQMDFTAMSQIWSGRVTEVTDLGNGCVSIIYDDPNYAARGDDPPTSTVPAVGMSGHAIAVGDNFVLKQNFRNGTAAATVNGKLYHRWTGMAVRPEPVAPKPQP